MVSSFALLTMKQLTESCFIGDSGHTSASCPCSLQNSTKKSFGVQRRSSPATAAGALPTLRKPELRQ